MDSDYPFGISKLFLKWSKTKSKFDTLYDKEKQNEHIFYILYLYVKCIDVASFCHFDIWFLNCFDSVVYFVFHLLYKKVTDINQNGGLRMTKVKLWRKECCNLCIGYWSSIIKKPVYILTPSTLGRVFFNRRTYFLHTMVSLMFGGITFSWFTTKGMFVFFYVVVLMLALNFVIWWYICTKENSENWY